MEKNLEAFLNHLDHPLFQIPILSFIEEHCIVFSPDVNNCEEYKKIHKEYQDIAMGLLESFRSDLGLSHEDLVLAITAINKTKANMRSYFRAIEQVVAIDDFPVFVSLMQNMNQELQEQAMAIIQQMLLRGGRVVGSQNATSPASGDNDDDVIAMVMRISKEEYEQEVKKRESDKNAIESQLNKETASKLAISKSNAPEVSAPPLSDLSAIPSVHPPPAPVSPSKRSTAQIHPPPSVPPRSSVPQVHPPPASLDTSDSFLASAPLLMPRMPPIKPGSSGDGSQSAAAAWLASAQEETKGGVGRGDLSGGGDLNVDERQKFLREQRDILMAKKRAEREKQMQDLERSSKTSRPASARTARNLLDKKTPLAGPPAPSEEEEKKLAMRRAIAAKLKAEVVDQP